jgi:molecular chaperone DnaK (HSP70)
MNVVIAVGCGVFDDPRISRLAYADRDAERFEAIMSTLVDPTDSRITALHGGAGRPDLMPTRAAIIREVSQLVEVTRGRPIETLIFYYSGHGYRSATGSDFLLARDSLTSALDDTAVSCTLLQDYLRRAGARCTVLMLDACRSQLQHDKAAGVRDHVPIALDKLCVSGTAVISSCAPEQASWESEMMGAGVFTAALCEALGDKGRCSTIYELNGYLQQRTPQISREAGRPLQTPYVKVEPLELQDASLISETVRRERQTSKRLVERRAGVVPRAENPDSIPTEICALDFGTTYSTIAFCGDDFAPRLVPDASDGFLVPSVVCFLSATEYVVGWDAMAAQPQRPGSTIANIKRGLIRGERWNVEGNTVSAELAASLVISSLRRNAEEYSGRTLRKVLVSMPADFSIAQSSALVRACELAGLTVERLIGEPSAAGLCALDLMASALPKPEDPIYERCALVVDLGGGTLDVAVVRATDLGDIDVAMIEVAGVSGNNHLGGIDFDFAIAQHVRSELESRGIPVGQRLWAAVLRESERAKIALGASDHTELVVPNGWSDHSGMHDVTFKIDRDLFNGLTSHLLDQIEASIRTAFQTSTSDGHNVSGISPCNVDVVVIAGQGGRLYSVIERLRTVVPNVHIDDRYQETGVIRGLALYSGVLQGKSKVKALLLDALYRGVAIRCHRLRKSDESFVAAISTKSAMNIEGVTLLSPGVMVPTQSELEFVVFGESAETMQIEFAEQLPGSSKVLEPLGQVSVGPVKDGTRLRFIGSVDADRTVVVYVANMDAETVTCHVLNNFFASERVTASGATSLPLSIENFRLLNPRSVAQDGTTAPSS